MRETPCADKRITWNSNYFALSFGPTIGNIVAETLGFLSMFSCLTISGNIVVNSEEVMMFPNTYFITLHQVKVLIIQQSSINKVSLV